jgi:hypothetical protein
MATKRYQKILATIKRNNPEFYEKLMEQEKGAKAEASRAPKPKAKNEPGSQKNEPDADYQGLLKAYKATHPKASALEAIRAIDRAVPLAREKFIEKQAGKRQPDASGYHGDLDPMDYKNIIRGYQRKYSCSYQEAMKMCDADHPNLRQEFIRQSNK